MSQNQIQHIPNPHHRDRQWSCADGFLQSITVGVGETYFVAFALAVQVDAVWAGLLTSIPILAGACLQLVSPWAIQRVGSHKRWVVACSFLQALSFLPLTWFAWIHEAHYLWLLGVFTLYYALGFSAGSAWNYWMSFLVPPALSRPYFAYRSQIAQAGILSGMLIAGLLLKIETVWGISAFAALFFLAFASRAFSSYCLSRKTYYSHWLQSEVLHSPIELWRELRKSQGGAQIPFIVLFFVTVYAASPYYTPLMLNHLHLPYMEFMVLLAVVIVSKMMIYPWLGRLAETRGVMTLYTVGCLGVALLPILWTLNHRFSYLLTLQVFQGMCWAAFEYAVFLTLFHGIEAHLKTQALSLYNLMTAIAMVIGSLIGGRILAWMGESLHAYHTLFWASSGARLICLLWLIPVAHRRWKLLATITLVPRRRVHRPSPTNLKTGS